MVSLFPKSLSKWPPLISTLVWLSGQKFSSAGEVAASGAQSEERDFCKQNGVSLDFILFHRIQVLSKSSRFVRN